VHHYVLRSGREVITPRPTPTLHHRGLAEVRAQFVDGVLGLRFAPVQEVGEVVAACLFEMDDADADQAEARRADFVPQQIAAGANPVVTVRLRR